MHHTADGFYEWKVAGGGKQPYHIRMKSRAQFGFAGNWSERKGYDESIKTAAIITSKPNEVAARVPMRLPRHIQRINLSELTPKVR